MFILSALRNDNKALPLTLDLKACPVLDEIFPLHVLSYMPQSIPFKAALDAAIPFKENISGSSKKRIMNTGLERKGEQR